MIAQLVLTGLLCVVMLYAWIAYQQSRVVGFSVICSAFAGLYFVWIPEHAGRQIGPKLHEKDTAKRKGVINAIKPYASHRFYALFLNTYGEAYGLDLLPPAGGHAAPARPPTETLWDASGGPRTRAHVPDPDPCPDPGPSPERPSGTIAVVDPPPEGDSAAPKQIEIGPFTRTRRPPGVVAHEHAFHVAAYERAVEAASGHPWAFDTEEFGVEQRLGTILSKHCPDPMRTQAWLDETVQAFVSIVKADPEHRGGYGPRELLKWLNAGRPKASPRREPFRGTGGLDPAR